MAGGAAGRREGLLMTGESTPDYMPDPTVAHRLTHDLPHTKVIIVLREPAARALSHFRFFVELKDQGWWGIFFLFLFLFTDQYRLLLRLLLRVPFFLFKHFFLVFANCCAPCSCCCAPCSCCCAPCSCCGMLAEDRRQAARSPLQQLLDVRLRGMICFSDYRQELQLATATASSSCLTAPRLQR